jgi:hypothetical protein
MSKRMPLKERGLPAVACQPHANEIDSLKLDYACKKQIELSGDWPERPGEQACAIGNALD